MNTTERIEALVMVNVAAKEFIKRSITIHPNDKPKLIELLEQLLPVQITIIKDGDTPNMSVYDNVYRGMELEEKLMKSLNF